MGRIEEHTERPRRTKPPSLCHLLEEGEAVSKNSLKVHHTCVAPAARSRRCRPQAVHFTAQGAAYSALELPSEPPSAADDMYSLASCTRRTLSCSITTTWPNASRVSCTHTPPSSAMPSRASDLKYTARRETGDSAARNAAYHWNCRRLGPKQGPQTRYQSATSFSRSSGEGRLCFKLCRGDLALVPRATWQLWCVHVNLWPH